MTSILKFWKTCVLVVILTVRSRCRDCMSVKEVEAQLGAKGRVLLRKSGTEPLLRVMVEGEDAELVKSSALKLQKL